MIRNDLAITGIGHRPSMLDGYGLIIHQRLVNLALTKLKELNPTKVISGGALGWDMALGEAAIKLDIPLDLYIPYLNYEEKWPISSQLRYKQLIDKANKVVYTGSNYHISLLGRRDEIMIESCDMVLALYNGLKSGGAYK